MMMHWSEPFIGIPWAQMGRTRDGCDCWGIVCLVYEAVLGESLDHLDGRLASVQERAEIAAVIADEENNGLWKPVEFGHETEFDVIVFHALGFQSHVGVVAGAGLMLHSTEGQPSGIVRYAEGRWRPRITGIYRHRSLA